MYGNKFEVFSCMRARENDMLDNWLENYFSHKTKDSSTCSLSMNR